jgi:hypothetical protein
MYESQTTEFAMLRLVVGAELINSNPSTVIDTRKTAGEAAIKAITVHLDWHHILGRLPPRWEGCREWWFRRGSKLAGERRPRSSAGRNARASGRLCSRHRCITGRKVGREWDVAG